MELKKVSIIVPVYNAEKYLKKCLDSIINQTYRKLELIIIEDGSPDNCRVICDEYAAKDNRIKVIHQKNCGVAYSRNVGLKRTTGDYVFFVDADDILALDAIDVMIKYAIRNNADMVCAKNKNINESGIEIIPKNKEYKEDKVRKMNKSEAMRFYAQKEWGPWNRLIKTEVHKSVSFPNYKIHEDEAIKFKLIERCSTIIHIPNITYYYRQRTGSITDEKTIKMDMFYSRRENLEWLNEQYSDVGKLFLPKVCEDAFYNLGLLCKQQGKDHCGINEIINFFRKYGSNIILSKYCSKSYKLRTILIIFSNWKKKNCMYIRFYRKLGKL